MRELIEGVLVQSRGLLEVEDKRQIGVYTLRQVRSNIWEIEGPDMRPIIFSKKAAAIKWLQQKGWLGGQVFREPT